MRTKPFNKLCYVEIKPMAWWVDVSGGGGTSTILLISLLSPIFFTLFLPSNNSSSSATTARTEFFPGLRFGSPNICHVNKSHNQFHTKHKHTHSGTHGLETALMSHFHPLVLYRVHKENNHKYKYFRPFALPPSASPCTLWHCFGGIRCAISLTHPVPMAQFHFIIIQPLSNVSVYWLNFFVRSFVRLVQTGCASSHILKHRTDVYARWFICFITAPRIHIIELLYIL